MTRLPFWLTTIFANEWAGAAPPLTAPVNADVLNTTTPTFTWTGVGGAVSYDIEIRAVLTGTPTATGIAALTYTPSALDTFTTYSWAVRAVNAGGAAGAWSAARAFIVPQLTFTQSAGTELLTDGGVEVWDDATTLHTPWSKFAAGASSINREATTIHGGTYAARLDIDGSGSVAQIAQVIAASINDTLEVTFWGASSPAGRNGRVDIGSAGGVQMTLPAAYQQYVNTFRILANNPDVKFVRGASAANSSLYGDDFVAKKITLNALQTGVADAENVFAFTLTASPIARQRVSLRFRVNATTPLLNYLNLMLVRNDTNTAWICRLEKAVSGTISTPAGWVDIADAGAPDAIRAIANGSNLTLWTRTSGVWTQRGGTITETDHQTNVGVLAFWNSGALTAGDKSLYNVPLV